LIDIFRRQQKFHRHDEISIRAGKAILRRVGQVVTPKLRKNDFFFYSGVATDVADINIFKDLRIVDRIAGNRWLAALAYSII
jgi:hypothetical protein